MEASFRGNWKRDIWKSHLLAGKASSFVAILIVVAVAKTFSPHFLTQNDSHFDQDKTGEEYLPFIRSIYNR